MATLPRRGCASLFLAGLFIGGNVDLAGLRSLPIVRIQLLLELTANPVPAYFLHNVCQQLAVNSVDALDPGRQERAQRLPCQVGFRDASHADVFLPRLCHGTRHGQLLALDTPGPFFRPLRAHVRLGSLADVWQAFCQLTLQVPEGTPQSL